MAHEKRAAQLGNTLAQPMRVYIVKKLLMDTKGPAGKIDLRFTLADNALVIFSEVLGHMRRLRRGTNGGNRFCFGNIARSRKNGRPAKRMADEKAWGLV